MKAGVRTTPWGRVRVPARAGPAVPSSVNSNIRRRVPSPTPGRSAAGAPGRAPAMSFSRWLRLSGPRSLCIPSRASSAGPRRPSSVRLATAEHPQLVQRTIQRHVGVAEQRGPPVLVVALERRSLGRQDHPDPEAQDQLRVGEMLHHLGDRPLPGRLRADPAPPARRLALESRSTAPARAARRAAAGRRGPRAAPARTPARPPWRRPPDWKGHRGLPRQRITIASP